MKKKIKQSVIFNNNKIFTINPTLYKIVINKNIADIKNFWELYEILGGNISCNRKNLVWEFKASYINNDVSVGPNTRLLYIYRGRNLYSIFFKTQAGIKEPIEVECWIS